MILNLSRSFITSLASSGRYSVTPPDQKKNYKRYLSYMRLKDVVLIPVVFVPCLRLGNELDNTAIGNESISRVCLSACIIFSEQFSLKLF